MRWSGRIGQIAGIDIYIHWTFWILILWLLGVHLVQGQSVHAAVQGVGLVLAVFGCVVLHELGHALAARRFGIQTRDITILPIGGVARLERIPEEPAQELWVALAGPMVNLVIAAGIFALQLFAHSWASATDLRVVGGNFLSKLMAINVGLALFNLLPAFPMDGGRVVRALLASRFDYAQATQWAATLGQVMAFLFGAVGLLAGNFWLLFIALFVYLGAQQEAYAVQIRSVLRGVPVRSAMITQFRSLSSEDPLERALSELISGYQQDFPVLEGSRLVGLLTRSDVLRALSEGRREARVADLMRPICQAVDDLEMLETTYQRMQEGQCPVLPVLRAGTLVGLITLENIAEWMMIQSALAAGLKARPSFQNSFS
ncbi:MAG: site-2 protease family protein [Thermoguttaceae bacterium]|nr:site-2 protease family protein [Thermoguttaceae bacterium]MDW8039779.1 site-2 protease family protein [Thermoguttaceae bacterium]